MTNSNPQASLLDLYDYEQYLTPNKKEKGTYHCPSCDSKLSINKSNGEKFTCYGCGDYSAIRKSILKLAGGDASISSQEMERRQARQQQKTEQERVRVANLQTETERNGNWLKIVSGSTLSDRHRQEMKDRGWSDEWIDRCQARSSSQGRIIPILTANGMMVGSQVALNAGGKTWYGSAGTHHLQETHELPLLIVYPNCPKQRTDESGHTIGTIAYTESTLDKPWLCAQLRNCVTIGSSNISSQPKDLERSIAIIKAKYGWDAIEHVLMADGGSHSNQNVMGNYDNLRQQIGSIGEGTLLVGWWGQVDKVVGDIDEISVEIPIEKILFAEFVRKGSLPKEVTNHTVINTLGNHNKHKLVTICLDGEGDAVYAATMSKVIEVSGFCLGEVGWAQMAIELTDAAKLVMIAPRSSFLTNKYKHDVKLYDRFNLPVIHYDDGRAGDSDEIGIEFGIEPNFLQNRSGAPKLIHTDELSLIVQRAQNRPVEVRLLRQRRSLPTADIVLNQRYLQTSDIRLGAGKYEFYISSTGTGKTKSAVGRVITERISAAFFSPRRSLNDSNHEICEQLSMSIHGEHSKVLHLCPDSILNEGMIEKLSRVKVLFIDEHQLTQSHLIMGGTLGQRAAATQIAMVKAMAFVRKNGGTVVFLEANTSAESIDNWKKLIEQQGDVFEPTIVHNEYSDSERHITVINESDKNEAMRLLFAPGFESTAVYHDSAADTLDLGVMLNQDNGEGSNLGYCRPSMYNDKCGEFRNNPTQMLLDNQNIISLGYTSVMQTGVSIDAKPDGTPMFHNTIALIGRTGTVPGGLQAVCRVRNSSNMFVHIPTNLIATGAVSEAATHKIHSFNDEYLDTISNSGSIVRTPFGDAVALVADRYVSLNKLSSLHPEEDLIFCARNAGITIGRKTVAEILTIEQLASTPSAKDIKDRKAGIKDTRELVDADGVINAREITAKENSVISVKSNPTPVEQAEQRRYKANYQIPLSVQAIVDHATSQDATRDEILEIVRKFTVAGGGKLTREAKIVLFGTHPELMRIYEEDAGYNRAMASWDKSVHTVLHITKSDLSKAKFVSLIAPMFNEAIAGGKVRRTDDSLINMMKFVERHCKELSQMSGAKLAVTGRKTVMHVFNIIARIMLWTPGKVTQEPTVKGFKRRNENKISVYYYTSKLDGICLGIHAVLAQCLFTHHQADITRTKGSSNLKWLSHSTLSIPYIDSICNRESNSHQVLESLEAWLCLTLEGSEWYQVGDVMIIEGHPPGTIISKNDTSITIETETHVITANYNLKQKL